MASSWCAAGAECRTASHECTCSWPASRCLDSAAMHREYVRWWSPALGRDMELLRFGHAGTPVVAFPASMGRFYQWEDFGLVGAIAPEIDEGRVRLWCVDSVDGESWYAGDRPARDRIRRHLEYERYVLDEVLAEVPGMPVLTGPSFGAFHAVLFCLR